MKSVYKGTNAVILLYDVCNSDSVAAVGDWVQEIREFASGEALIYLVGTKIDESGLRVSTFRQGENIARNLEVNYWELSSKSGQDVDTLFYKIVANYTDLARSSVTSSSLFSSRHSESVRESELLKQKEGEDEVGGASFCPCVIS
jgi:GTPase SAR1 family protein